MESMRYGEQEWRDTVYNDPTPVWLSGESCAVGVIEAMFDHLPNPEGWSVADVRRMDSACQVTYTAGPRLEDAAHEQVGLQYLDDHYPGVAGDSLVKLRRDQVRLIGFRVAHAEHESGRSWWYSCDTAEGCGHLHHFDPTIATGDA